jgi:hypothetical protein
MKICHYCQGPVTGDYKSGEVYWVRCKPCKTAFLVAKGTEEIDYCKITHYYKGKVFDAYVSWGERLEEPCCHIVQAQRTVLKSDNPDLITPQNFRKKLKTILTFL